VASGCFSLSLPHSCFRGCCSILSSWRGAKAELEILSLHEKLAEVREKKWGELLRLQREQIQLLAQLLQNLGEGADEAPKNTEDMKTGE
jgi:uncharacterized membrane protein